MYIHSWGPKKHQIVIVFWKRPLNFTRDLESTIPGDYFFNGRLDCQSIYIYTVYISILPHPRPKVLKQGFRCKSVIIQQVLCPKLNKWKSEWTIFFDRQRCIHSTAVLTAIPAIPATGLPFVFDRVNQQKIRDFTIHNEMPSLKSTCFLPNMELSFRWFSELHLVDF